MKSVGIFEKGNEISSFNFLDNDFVFNDYQSSTGSFLIEGCTHHDAKKVVVEIIGNPTIIITTTKD